MNAKISDLEIAKKMINLHQSANSRNLEFDLSFETLKSLMTKPTCFYTGIKFEDSGHLMLSIDRIDSSKGYVEGNVVSCTVDINLKKANLSLVEIGQIYTKLLKFMNPISATNTRTPKKEKKNEKPVIENT